MNNRIEQLKEFLIEDPNDPFLIYALGLEYVKEKTPELAVETFLVLIKNNQNTLPLNTSWEKYMNS